jgi:(p)ppGpp synthase/HD superfamily hydrolase
MGEQNSEITVLGAAFANAVAYAAWLHRDQGRKATGIPYMAHLLGVAALVLDQGGDEEEAIAALLHDALEDQWERTSEDELRARFGDKATQIVVACSDSLGGEKREWQARKSDYLDHLRAQPPEVLRVSLADKLHNARSMVADLRTVGDDLWRRFTGTPAQQAWYYGSLLEIFRERDVSPLVAEFEVAVAELQQRALAVADPATA